MFAFNMKFLIVLTFFKIVDIVQADVEFKQMVDKAVLECRSEIGANQDEIDNYINHLPQTTTTGKCFVACIHEKFHIQDKSGKFDRDGTREAVKLLKLKSDDAFNQLNHVAEICLEQVHEKEDKCEVAMSWINCLIKESKIAGYPPFLADL